MQVDFVLGKWFPEELEVVQRKIGFCIETIENVAVMGLERTMNIVNQMEFT
jgi:PTH1 family peptidyl-tRNA hydrolase